jgi:hypothetical protein
MDTFHYTPKAALTVGEIRAALADYPDDMPVQVAVPDDSTPDGPFARTVNTNWVVLSVAPMRWGNSDGNSMVWTEETDRLTIECDFAAGEYDRTNSGEDA